MRVARSALETSSSSDRDAGAGLKEFLLAKAHPSLEARSGLPRVRISTTRRKIDQKIQSIMDEILSYAASCQAQFEAVFAEMLLKQPSDMEGYFMEVRAGM